MAKSSINHTFGVQVTYTDGSDGKPVHRVDTFQSIKKPIYSVRFGQHLPDDSVTLAYVAVNEIDADENVELTDYSTDIVENSREFTQEEDTFTGKIYNSSYQNLLATDVWTDVIPTQPAKPLYFKHTIPSTVNYLTVTILDSDMQPIPSYLYKVERIYVYNETTGVATTTIDYIAVYNDLENTYDEESGEFTAYYVQYITADNEVKTVLLNNEPVFRPATTQDIWTNAKLKPWLKVYLVENISSYFKLKFAYSSNYSIKILENARIYLQEPAVDEKEFPWFVRVANGSFVSTTSDTVSLVYDIPEFRSQLFNPIQPYKIAPGQPVDKIAPGIVQLNHENTMIGTFPIDIIIYDSDNTVLHALTTDPLKISLEYQDTGILWSSTRITSWDNKGGFVHLDLDIKDYYKIYATYYYEETTYEYTLLDLNPIFNTDSANGGFYAIYLVPRSTVNYGLNAEATIFHVKVDKSGTIVATSETALNDTVANGGIIGMTYGDRNDPVAGTFLYNYTVLAPSGASGQTYKYFVIGHVSVVKTTSSEDVTLLDLRVNGGGIKEDLIDSSKQLNPEINWYTDIGSIDGIPYPGQCANIVKLPYTILSDYGGRFTKPQVREIVKKHMALGTYPLIRYYGATPEPYLSEDSLDLDGVIKLYWKRDNPLYSFNIYRSLQENGRYTKINSSPIAGNTNNQNNWYYITGLKPGIVYWFYMTSIDSNSIEGPKSKKIKVVPYADGITNSNIGYQFNITI